MGKQLQAFVLIALKNGIRDRVLHAILAVGLLLLFTIPVVAVFSMRQVMALAVSYSLSVIALVGLLLTLFLSLGLLSRDLERRSIYTVCSLPLSRSTYLLGGFLGFALLLLVAVVILSLFAACALYLLSVFYPPEPVFSWGHFLVALWFQYWTFLIVGAVTLVFSTFATSTFLPLALSVGIYFASFSTESVKYYVDSAAGSARTAPALKGLVHLFYWVLPNLSAFDFKVQTIYHLPIEFKAIVLTQVYAVGYLTVMLIVATLAFNRREFL